ncbi:MAG: phage tail assembly protein [Acidimicrobiia bacterium]|nr:MAG: phage tail assembly protein [Acidimicrobiia bacterium]
MNIEQANHLYFDRHVLAAILKMDVDGITEEAALSKIADLADQAKLEPEDVNHIRLRHGDHPSAKLNADGTVTVTMTWPFTHAKETISELKMRPPVLGDHQAIAGKAEKGVFDLLARCVGRTTNELAGMHTRDFVVCASALGFLQGAG